MHNIHIDQLTCMHHRKVHKYGVKWTYIHCIYGFSLLPNDLNVQVNRIEITNFLEVLPLDLI
jgi:hypothetical protein